MPSILISAAHKSSGKTTVTLGLCAALTARGLVVQPFKKGPDYIDPLWLTQAANRPCHNLDFYTMSREEIIRTVTICSQGADFSIIEGNKGLYDGLDVAGSNSNAALAQLLGVPVVLVLDTQGMTRGIAPLILGYQTFDQTIQIAGVILNQVGGQRHESKLRAAIEYYTTLPVLGAIYQDSRLAIQERHLGLMPSNEDEAAHAKIKLIGEIIGEQVNLEELVAVGHRAMTVGPTLTDTIASSDSIGRIKFTDTIASSDSIGKIIKFTDAIAQSDSIGDCQPKVKLGILRDAAFGFYYPGDLLALQAAGAELIFIDALQSSHLPDIDALFIGGGFPEVHLAALARNQSLKQEIKMAIEQALPVYAECGGLMYLSRHITWQGNTGEMVGALPCDTVMEERPQGRGYVRLRETGKGLWPLRNSQGQLAEFQAHEFHYSRIVKLSPELPLAYEVLRGVGLDGRYDGIVYKNTLASYVHLRDVENNRWTQRFVNFIRDCKHSKVQALATCEIS